MTTLRYDGTSIKRPANLAATQKYFRQRRLSIWQRSEKGQCCTTRAATAQRLQAGSCTLRPPRFPGAFHPVRTSLPAGCWRTQAPAPPWRPTPLSRCNSARSLYASVILSWTIRLTPSGRFPRKDLAERQAAASPQPPTVLRRPLADSHLLPKYQRA